MHQPLAFFLQQPYPYTVSPVPEGGYFIAFPDLPGCMTQVGESHEIPAAADEIRSLWLEAAYAQHLAIPLPRVNADDKGLSS